MNEHDARSVTARLLGEPLCEDCHDALVQPEAQRNTDFWLCATCRLWRWPRSRLAPLIATNHYVDKYFAPKHLRNP